MVRPNFGTIDYSLKNYLTDHTDYDVVTSPYSITRSEYSPIYEPTILSTQALQQLMETTVENHRKEVTVKAVKELHCPNCNAPIKLKDTNLDGAPIMQNCEYCGSLLSFETK